MSAAVEAHLSSNKLALDESLEKVPNLGVEIVPTVGTGSTQLAEDPFPYLRASAPGERDLQRVLTNDPSTDRVEELGTTEEHALFRVEWAPEVRITFRCFLVQGATVLEARGAPRGWWFRLIFPEHDAIRRTFDVCESHSIDLNLEAMSSLNAPLRDRKGSITGLQLETIREAYESGYYKVPREASLIDLAGEIGVSHQALSERMRRGHGALVKYVLAPQIE